MSLDLSQLLVMSYYTFPSPGGDFIWGYFLLAFFFALVFSPSLTHKFFPRNKYFRKAIKGRLGKLMAVGILGVLAVLFRFGTIPFLSMRLWLYILFLLGLIFVFWTIFATCREYKRRLLSAEREKKRKAQKKKK